MDEVALCRLLRGAVQDLEPADGTLDHLHRAVPARRARRRQGVVGAAAAALLIGTAIIFACGIAWLSTLIGLPKAINAGLVPFLLSEAVKIALATALGAGAVAANMWRVLRDIEQAGNGLGRHARTTNGAGKIVMGAAALVALVGLAG